ncbi:MAG: hypothetical protein KIG88_09570 [Weeksellaceae bacterium]|nr:hypothetical protein [Weeksellaceae bacterium]
MKLTPFLIVLGLIEIILFILSINFIFIDNNGGKALGGVIALLGFIIIGIILGVEQLILQSIKVNSTLIFIIETILLLLFALYIFINGFSIG